MNWSGLRIDIRFRDGLARCFSRFKMELIEGGAFEDISEARTEIFSYIEGYYNRVRLHSSLGYQSPMEFELKLKTKNGVKDREFYVH